MAEDTLLLGLALAGGQSRRMARDKGSLYYQGQAQVQRVAALFNRLKLPFLVSVRARQASMSCYRGLPLVHDVGDVAGPAAGLLAAWADHPGSALLVLAVDMPDVDLMLLHQLVSARNSNRIATAFANAEGRVEPLCTIWEPHAQLTLAAGAAAGNMSLRKLLEESEVQLLTARDPAQLVSVNTPAQYDEACTRVQS